VRLRLPDALLSQARGNYGNPDVETSSKPLIGSFARSVWSTTMPTITHKLIWMD
jgi:hypothetical protein